MNRDALPPMRVASIGGMFPASIANHLHENAVTLADRFRRRLGKNHRAPPHAILFYFLGYDISKEAVAPSSLTHIVEFLPAEQREAHVGSQWLRKAFDRSSPAR